MVEGEKAEFVCSVSKDTYEVKWFRGDKELQSGDKYDIVSDGTRRLLVIKKCEHQDEGSYTAFIGTVKASADLTVIGKHLYMKQSLSRKKKEDRGVKKNQQVVSLF